VDQWWLFLLALFIGSIIYGDANLIKPIKWKELKNLIQRVVKGIKDKVTHIFASVFSDKIADCNLLKDDDLLLEENNYQIFCKYNSPQLLYCNVLVDFTQLPITYFPGNQKIIQSNEIDEYFKAIRDELKKGGKTFSVMPWMPKIIKGRSYKYNGLEGNIRYLLDVTDLYKYIIRHQIIINSILLYIIDGDVSIGLTKYNKPEDLKELLSFDTYVIMGSEIRSCIVGFISFIVKNSFKSNLRFKLPKKAIIYNFDNYKELLTQSSLESILHKTFIAKNIKRNYHLKIEEKQDEWIIFIVLLMNANKSLHMTVMEDNINAVQILLDEGADINAKEHIKSHSPLHLVRSTDMADFLLSQGANINAKDRNGVTPLLMTIDPDYLPLDKSLSIAKLLLNNGANVFNRDNDGMTILHGTALCNRIDMAKVILSKGIDINVIDKIGRTPLHIAVIKNNSNLMEFFIDNRADITARMNDGSTPLHVAAYLGHEEIVERLLKRNRNIINDKGGLGLTPLDFAIQKAHNGVEKILRKYDAH